MSFLRGAGSNQFNSGRHRNRRSTVIEQLSMGVVKSVAVGDQAKFGRKKKPRCLIFMQRAYNRFGLKHVLLVLILLAYTSVGAFVFLVIEEPEEVDRMGLWHQDLSENRSQFVGDLMRTLYNNTEYLTFISNTRSQQISQHLAYRLQEYEKDIGVRPKEGPALQWTFSSAFFYSMTIYTTIGYGHIYPTTNAGRIFTMIYAIFGIPLVLTILNDLGKLLTVAMKYPWYQTKRIFRRLCKCFTKQTKESIAKIETEERANLDIFDLPIPTAIGIVVGWIFICSATFCVWESNWGYFRAFYFFFISLSTIGLGDVLPEHPQYLIFGFGFIFLGLSLVSMCINVIQMNLEKTYQMGEGGYRGAGRTRTISVKRRVVRNNPDTGLPEASYFNISRAARESVGNKSQYRRAVLGIFAGGAVAARSQPVPETEFEDVEMVDAETQTFIRIPGQKYLVYVDANGNTYKMTPSETGSITMSPPGSDLLCCPDSMFDEDTFMSHDPTFTNISEGNIVYFKPEPDANCNYLTEVCRENNNSWLQMNVDHRNLGSLTNLDNEASEEMGDAADELSLTTIDEIEENCPLVISEGPKSDAESASEVHHENSLRSQKSKNVTSNNTDSEEERMCSHSFDTISDLI